MTERDRRPGGTEDNVRDEQDEATGVRRKSDAEREALEEEGPTGSGGVKDNVRDEQDETQERS
jgi:hypothetical protein